MTAAPLPPADGSPDGGGAVHPVEQLLAGAAGELREAQGRPVWSMDAVQTGRALRAVFTVESQVAALKLALIAHGDEPSIDVPAHDPAGCAVSMVAWLRLHAHLSPAQARRLVRLAHALEDHEATRTALGEGSIPVASAAVIVDAVASLPRDLDRDLRVQGERLLVEHARTFDTRDLTLLAARLEHVLDPETADRREADHLARLEADAERDCFATLQHDHVRGVSDLTARLPLLAGLKLQRQLEALLNPARPGAGDGDGDGNHNDGNDGNDNGRVAAISDRGAGGRIERVDERGVRLSAAHRRGLALTSVIDRVPLTTLPASGGCEPTVVVTMDLDTLLGAAKPAMVDTGHRISAGLARRLAARHGVIPAVLGGRSEVLDLGRKARLASKKQRLALAVQQHGTCAVEGCDTPVSWAEAAHLVAWKRGGPTDLRNLALACRPHHRQADHPDYRVTRVATGRIRINRRT